MERNELSFENEMYFYLTQSMLGCITPEFRAVGFDVDEPDQAIDVYFALSAPVHQMEEIIYDIEASMDGLTGGAVLVRSHVWIGPNWIEGWPGRTAARRVFASRLST